MADKGTCSAVIVLICSFLVKLRVSAETVLEYHEDKKLCTYFGKFESWDMHWTSEKTQLSGQIMRVIFVVGSGLRIILSVGLDVILYLSMVTYLKATGRKDV